MIANIPYRVIWWQKFYDRKEVKDLLGYLRVIHNQNDVVSMKRIINTPTRKIWNRSIEIIDNYRENFWLTYPQIIQNIEEVDELKWWARNAIKAFNEIFEDLVKISEQKVVSELIREIIKKTWYEEYITEWLSKEEKDAKLENIDELVNVATEYNWMEPRESLAIFLEEVALITDMDKWDERPDYVTLMTIHTSKWLEEKRVFLTWLEDGIFPSFRSVNDSAALEEERRLMYVAMTRAREELYISRAKERFHFWDYTRNPESRFLKEIPLEYLVNYDLWEYLKNSTSYFWTTINTKLESHSLKSDSNIRLVRTITNNDVSQFNRWDKVNHPKFGNWIITSLEWELAEIAFSWNWIKKMNIKIAPVRKI
jgi:DNA helicase-2/ATP-dependent DNA helicase PcrA